MHDHVRADVLQDRGQPVVLLRQVKLDEPDLPARNFRPGTQPLPDISDRCQRSGAEIDVGFAAAEVIQDRHVVAAVGQVQRGRPPAVPITAGNQHAQSAAELTNPGSLLRSASLPQHPGSGGAER
jgi:hypothetical protein